jgi:hypothetical protein
MHSNGNSFSNGGSMDLGSGASYGVRDGSRPPSAAWMFAVTIWRI